MKKFLRKYLIGIIAVALILAGGGGAFAAIGSQEADRGDNPIVYESPDSMKVFPEGKGYKLSKQQMQAYQLPEKIKKLAEQNSTNGVNPLSPSTTNTTTGSSFYRPNTGTWRPGPGMDSRSNANDPRINTNIPKLITDNKYKEGDKMSFWVQATTYLNAVIYDKNIKVTCNGKELTASESGPGSFTYTAELSKEENSIVITAEDIVQKRTAKIEYKVKTGEKDENSDESTKPTKEPTTPTESTESAKYKVNTSIAISVPSVEGISNISETDKLELKEGKTVKDALKGIYPGIVFTEDGNIKAVPVLQAGKRYSLSQSKVDELTNAGFIPYEKANGATPDFRISIMKPSYPKLANGDFVTAKDKDFSGRVTSGWTWSMTGNYKSLNDKVRKNTSVKFELSFVIMPAQ